MINTIIAVVLYTVALLWNVDRHYKKWKSAQNKPDAGNAVPIKHKMESFIRIAVFTPSIIFFSWSFNIWEIAASISMVFCVTWFLFDGLFNTKRGKNWWFIGTVDKDEPSLDNLKRKLGLTLTKIIQISLAVGSVVLKFSI